MAENKNMKLDDAAMAKATGGELDPFYETAVITGIVMVNPLPEDEGMSTVWEDCQSSGYSVYEISGPGQFAVSSETYDTGDEVYVDHIRGFYGWKIKGRV